MIKEFSYKHNESRPECRFFGISFSIVKWGKNYKYINHFLGSGYPKFLGKNKLFKKVCDFCGDKEPCNMCDPRLTYLHAVINQCVSEHQEQEEVKYWVSKSLDQLDKRR